VLSAKPRSKSIRRWPTSPITLPPRDANAGLGAARRQCRPSRWAISRSAPRSAAPGWPRSARAAKAGRAWPPRRWSRRPGLHDRHAGRGARLRRQDRRPGLARGVGDPEDRRGGISWLNGESTGAHGSCSAAASASTTAASTPPAALGDAAALDAATGALIWRVRPAAAARRADHRQRQCLCDEPGQSAVRAQPADGKVRWNGSGTSRPPACSARRARRRAGHGGRRLLLGRADRLPLREWPRRLAGRAGAHQHLDRRRPSPTSTPIR
jgi:hypothetical protein